jgi:uncharacterized membrane protein
MVIGNRLCGKQGTFKGTGINCVNILIFEEQGNAFCLFSAIIVETFIPGAALDNLFNVICCFSVSYQV